MVMTMSLPTPESRAARCSLVAIALAGLLAACGDSGGGKTVTVAVKVKNTTRSMTLTSQYSWLYNQYPFSNDPQGDLLHPDWWITECGCVPAATTPDGMAADKTWSFSTLLAPTRAEVTRSSKSQFE